MRITLGIMGLSLAMMSMQACRKDRPEIGEPFSKTDGLADSWVLTKVLQVDEANPLKESRDLSEYYGLGGSGGTGTAILEIMFDGTDRQFRMTPGQGKNFLAPGFKDPLTIDSLRLKGSWSFTNELNPSFAETAPEGIQLINAMDDTVSLLLDAPVRPYDTELGLKIVRCKLSYVYYFTRKD
ncbi:MAG: hypothetical protein EP332_14115 [Bacteroidetes bacterium]|nr:MAG: hypothetical protein EP332_14115 [Bacteroidota bacterium]